MRHPKFANSEVIAVAPMAGRGTRLGLAISKELAELSPATANTPATVLSEIMLRRMLSAGIRQAVFTVAQHKQDVHKHYGTEYRQTGAETLQLTYVSANDSPNTPTSIAAAFPEIKGRVCALGFADILYAPCAGYARALSVLNLGRADVVLGLFPTQQATSSDMVAFNADGSVEEIVIKQAAGKRLAYTWSLAVWRPVFTEFLSDWLKRPPSSGAAGSELYVGDAVIAAMNAGLRVDASVVSTLPSLDAGTPETLALARSRDW